MSLNLPEILQSLAMSQLTMVAPALGESYAGKTAGTIAVLALVTSTLQQQLMNRAPALRQQLEALLAGAAITDPALRDGVRRALADDCAGDWFARGDVLMQALADVHAWADDHDAALARQCRGFLLDHASAEMVTMPDMTAI